MEQEKVLFHAVISALYLYGDAWNSMVKKQNSNQNVNVEKMVVFVKTFNHYHQIYFWKLFQLSSKTIKEFKTEI